MSTKPENKIVELNSVAKVANYLRKNIKDDCIIISNCEIKCDFNLIDIIRKIEEVKVQVDKENNQTHIINEKFICENVVFHGDADFSYLNFDGSVSFNNITFNKIVKFIGCHFHDKGRHSLKITECEFHGLCTFEGSCFKSSTYIDYITVHNEISFKYCNFYNITTLSRIYLNEAKNRLLLCNSVIYSILHIDKCSSNNLLDISRILVVKNGMLRITSLNFIEKLEPSTDSIPTNSILDGKENFKSYHGYLIMEDMVIDGYLFFMNVWIYKINLKGTVISGQLTECELNYRDNANKETATLLLNAAKKSSDTINTINHRAEELNYFLKESTRNRLIRILCKIPQQTSPNNNNDEIENSSNSIVTKPYKSIRYLSSKVNNKWNGNIISYFFFSFSSGDLLSLWLNKYSNNFGISWKRGVCFTITVWVIFFSIFVMLRDGWGCHFIWADSNYLNEAVSYLWLPSGLDKLVLSDSSCFISNWFRILIFILGKILIGYGIYQTISAFRKFGK